MKQTMLVTALGLLFGLTAVAQKNDDETPIRKTIGQFTQAADTQDADALSAVLDANYRIVMNQLFGSTEVMIMDRATYLSKIKNKEFGGDKRELKIEQIILNGKTANAKVMLKGAKMTFVSLLQLVKTNDGAWKVISDMPTIL